MSRADFNFANNFSENKNFNQNFEGFDDIWQAIDDISSISFELHIPKQNITKSENTSEYSKYFMTAEEILMRQNLVDLAIKESTTVRENKANSFVDLLVKKDKDIFTQNFAGHISDMTDDDAKFFQLILSNQNITLNNSGSVIVEDENGEKNLQKLNFSKSVMNLIEYAYTSNRPIRMDFAGDLSVIIKIDKQGQISAEFISSDKAMEYLLKTNIPLLRQKLESEGIKYKKIFYREEEKE